MRRTQLPDVGHKMVSRLPADKKAACNTVEENCLNRAQYEIRGIRNVILVCDVHIVRMFDDFLRLRHG